MAFALAGSACRNADQLQDSKQPREERPPELVLTPMQLGGLRHFADLSKQRRASAEALARVTKAMEAYLFDPGSALYRSIRIGRNGSVCGKYNAKNRYGAYVGYKDFVMDDAGRVVASDTGQGLEGSSNADYIEAYLESCASKAQVAAYKSATEELDFGGSEQSQTLSNHSTDDSAEPEQEPDRILDAPLDSPRKRPVDIPTT